MSWFVDNFNYGIERLKGIRVMFWYLESHLDLHLHFKTWGLWYILGASFLRWFLANYDSRINNFTWSL